MPKKLYLIVSASIDTMSSEIQKTIYKNIRLKAYYKGFPVQTGFGSLKTNNNYILIFERS